MNLIPLARAFATEQDALETVERLKSGSRGLEDECVSVISPAMIQTSQDWLLTPGVKDGADSTEVLAELIISVHDGSRVPDSHAMVYADTIQEGKTVLLVTAPFGEGNRVEYALDQGKVVEMATVPELDYHSWMQAAPFSALLNIAVLSHRRSGISRTFPELKQSDRLPTSGLMGGLLSDNPAPLSSKVGMSTLTDNPAPLSSTVGLGLLTDNPAPLSSTVGINVLKDNPTPLSDKLGKEPLSDDRAAKKSSSFGLPLLSNNPTPLSTMFGLSVLSKKD